MTASSKSRSTREWQALDAAHYLHPFTDTRALAARGTRVITRAEGIYLYDSEGNRILDGMSGLWCVALGYGRSELAEAAYRQMQQLPYYNSFFQCANPPAIELAARLAELSPPALEFTPDASPLRRARIAIERGFERTHGGFGNGPKFIRTNLLERLLRDWRRSATSAEPDLQALFMVSLTLTRIAASPMRHASGLFHSHAARIDWSEPEPLLSAEDNGLLLALYAQLALATGERDFLRITRETAAALLQTLRLPDGAFAAHLDGGTAAAAARDERALIAPNAQVIRGLAWAARVLRDPALADAALAAIGAIGARHFRDGALRRADGRCADLDAHAALADAVLEALQQRWHAPTADLQRALLVALRTHFEDPVLGGFHAAADDAEPAPFQRLKIFADEATPAGNALAARVLLRAGALTEDRAAIEAARRTLALAWPAIQQQPQAHATLLGVLEETLSPPEVLVLRGAGDEIETARSDLQKVYAPTRLVFAIPEAAD